MYTDPVLELSSRGCGDMFELASIGATDEEAKAVLEVVNEMESREHAAELSADMRRAGLLW